MWWNHPLNNLGLQDIFSMVFTSNGNALPCPVLALGPH